MHRRRARRLHRVIVIVLLLGRILSLKLLRIVALLHWHRCITSLVSGRYTRRINSSTSSITLSLRRLASGRSIITSITAAVEKENGKANEAKGCNASNCTAHNGTHGSAAFAAA